MNDLVKDYANERRLVVYEVDLENTHQVTDFVNNGFSFGTIHLVVLSAGIMLAKEKVCLVSLNYVF